MLRSLTRNLTARDASAAAATELAHVDLEAVSKIAKSITKAVSQHKKLVALADNSNERRNLKEQTEYADWITAQVEEMAALSPTAIDDFGIGELVGGIIQVHTSNRMNNRKVQLLDGVSETAQSSAAAAKQKKEGIKLLKEEICFGKAQICALTEKGVSNSAGKLKKIGNMLSETVSNLEALDETWTPGRWLEQHVKWEKKKLAAESQPNPNGGGQTKAQKNAPEIKAIEKEISQCHSQICALTARGGKGRAGQGSKVSKMEAEMQGLVQELAALKGEDPSSVGRWTANNAGAAQKKAQWARDAMAEKDKISGVREEKAGKKGGRGPSDCGKSGSHHMHDGGDGG